MQALARSQTWSAQKKEAPGFAMLADWNMQPPRSPATPTAWGQARWRTRRHAACGCHHRR
eukprot:8441144-Pyramimonas_sp.AAC.1